MSSKDGAADEDAIDAQRAVCESLAQLREEFKAMVRQVGSGIAGGYDCDDGLSSLLCEVERLRGMLECLDAGPAMPVTTGAACPSAAVGAPYPPYPPFPPYAPFAPYPPFPPFPPYPPDCCCAPAPCGCSKCRPPPCAEPVSPPAPPPAVNPPSSSSAQSSNSSVNNWRRVVISPPSSSSISSNIPQVIVK